MDFFKGTVIQIPTLELGQLLISGRWDILNTLSATGQGFHGNGFCWFGACINEIKLYTSCKKTGITIILVFLSGYYCPDRYLRI